MTSNDEEQKRAELSGLGEEDDVVDLVDDEDDDDDEDDVEDVEDEECCICQDIVSLTKQGFLSSCDHRFHYDCIVTWSKVTNLCPLCKQKFSEVVRKDHQGNVVHREVVADTKQVFRPDPQDHDVAAQLRLVSNVHCEICGRGDDEHVLLMCEAPNCMVANHTYCVGLVDVPSHSWYCAQHQGAPSRASDLIARPASTVTSRRRTRRLATLMSNIMSGVGAVRRRPAGSSSSTGGTRRRTRASGRGRLAMPDGESLDLHTTRPIRGVALSYALRMSRELQAIQHRADEMYARGETSTSTLYAPPRGSLLARTRSTAVSSRSATDEMWDDYALSRRQLADAQARLLPDQRHTVPRASRAHRISPTFASEYGDLAQRMASAVSHDNYASTVSLMIPKTGRLRLVFQVKAFFAKLNDREKVASLEAGCLSLFFAWLRPPETANGASVSSMDLHPHVLDAVLTVLEDLPVRRQDLTEVKGFREALDALANQSDVGLNLRERCVVLSEKWREIDPPVVAAISTQSGSSRSRSHHQQSPQPPPTSSSLPVIQAFTTREEHSPANATTAPRMADAVKSAAKKRRAASHSDGDQTDNRTDGWSAIAVEYVKAKLYPVYKEAKFKMSKDQFKSIVKQVLERFRRDAAGMSSDLTRFKKDQTEELTGVAKKRLMQLLDQVYRETTNNNSNRTDLSQGSATGYSALPTSVKRPRTN